MFVFNNALLLVGSVGEILLVCVTAFFGVYALACAAQNYLGGRVPLYLRAFLFLGGGCLIYPGWLTDLAGLIIVVALLGVRVPDLFHRFTIGLLKRQSTDALVQKH